MDAHGEMGMFGEQSDPSLVARNRENEYENWSRSDRVEGDGASGDDREANENRPQRGRKKKNHRHTPHQIKQLEDFFKECPQPEKKQRLELARRLGLESKQIKFWFQNRRTQMKTQTERHENLILQREHDKLQTENDLLKEALKNPLCINCGGPSMQGIVSDYELQQLKAGNDRLKDELGWISALAVKLLGGPLESSASPVPLQGVNYDLDLPVGRNELRGVVNIPNSMVEMGLQFVEGPGTSSMEPTLTGMPESEMSIDRKILIALAFKAMDELIKMANTNDPLWIKSMDGGMEVFNQEEYMRTFSPCLGRKPTGFVTEASRETAVVTINTAALIETLLDSNRWAEMFPSLIARSSTVETINPGISGTRNGAMQVMFAEFQALSPLVPVRKAKFIRFCKQHVEGLWAVVDISFDANQEVLNLDPFQTYRRLPSGCFVQDLPNDYSKVTWIEHAEYDEGPVHHLCRPLLNSGLGFGAQRWVATLQRQCESRAILISSSIPNQDHSGMMSPNGRDSMLKLAKRMIYNFCSGVCASSVHMWDNLYVGNVGDDVRVLTRKNEHDPAEPPGVSICATTSVWIPVTRLRLFDFVRNEFTRSRWDILSDGEPMQEMVHIAKGQSPGNGVSLLCAHDTMNVHDSGMLILQETWNDTSGSLVVYAPVDAQSMSLVMNGGDSTCVALLPSGFAILPDGHFGHGGGGLNNCNDDPMIRTDGDKGESGGCLLTVGFQILVNSLPTAKLTVDSVETVNSLISHTIQKIKAAVSEA